MDAQFDYGEKVRVIKNIRNDGTFMGSDRGALLIRRGSEGYIKGVGKFLQDQVIYQVHFMEQGCTVGCRESELKDLNSPWVDRKFERGDRVIVEKSLSNNGQVVVEAGESGNILGLETDQKPYQYKVLFKRTDSQKVSAWVIPESVLSFDSSLPSKVKVMPTAMLQRSSKC